MMWEFGRASDPEGLRLMLTFFKIADPAQRLQLICFAEQLARASVDVRLQSEDVCRELVQDNNPRGQSP